MKAIVVMELDSASEALAFLVLDILSRRLTVLRSKQVFFTYLESTLHAVPVLTFHFNSVRKEKSYVTIPSRYDNTLTTTLVEEVNFTAQRPQLLAGPSSNTAEVHQNNTVGTIKLSFGDSRGIRTYFGNGHMD